MRLFFLGFELIRYLTRFRKSPYLKFREQQLVIDDNIKDSVVSRDQLRLHTEGLVQFIRHTGGIRFIVSISAIKNLDFHGMPPADLSYINKCIPKL